MTTVVAVLLSGCSLLGEWDEPFAYEDVAIPESVSVPGSRFEYEETALLAVEDGREVAVTFTQIFWGGPGNAGLAEIGPEWATPGWGNVTIGLQGDAVEGKSALPPDLVGILDDGSVALRATVDGAPDAIHCDESAGYPPQNDADSQRLRCAIYLEPEGRQLVEVRWVPSGGDAAYAADPVAWRVPSFEELVVMPSSAP